MGTSLSLLSQLAQEDATARVLEELVGVGYLTRSVVRSRDTPADCPVAYFGSG